ncbi:MAG: hypothetical protein J0L63_06535 [Anaerolineae bacterium]|nr:hypothetical protein [Anaerolineae bacterium]MBN8618542.1 hypothetical protein [Anaerolineae bacterium]
MLNVQQLAEEVLRNPSSGSRKLALHALHRYRKYPRINDLLDYVSRRDSDPEVRQFAAKLLTFSPDEPLPPAFLS